jgi:hypothetical protein
MVTAFAGMFICWSTIYLGKIALVGADQETDKGQNIGLLLAGITAGLSSTFSVSIWFSAMEGEVYAMSTFFTAITLWSLLKWYYLPDTKKVTDGSCFLYLYRLIHRCPLTESPYISGTCSILLFKKI